jgi:hypothetical protein
VKAMAGSYIAPHLSCSCSISLSAEFPFDYMISRTSQDIE